MKVKVNAVMVDVRVVAVIRHARDHLEVGVAGGEGYWPDEGRSGGPYTNLTATFRIFANTNLPSWQASHDHNQATLEAWRDEDTPLLVLDLSEPRDCILMLGRAWWPVRELHRHPQQRLERRAMTRWSRGRHDHPPPSNRRCWSCGGECCWSKASTC